MPYSEKSKYWHARQENPEKYSELRHGEIGKGIHVVYGIMAGGGSEIQAYLFPKDKFTTSQAKEWLRDNGKKSTINNENTGVAKLAGLLKELDDDKKKY